MKTPISQLISVRLPVLDPVQAERARAAIAPGALEPWPTQFLDAVMSASPYLARLMAKRADTLRALAEMPPHALVETASECARTACGETSEADAMRVLREAKMDVHLITALADLSGAWTLRETTAALSSFADAALHGALGFAAREMGLAGEDGAIPGYAVLALGKLGTQSLNYSSDIDLVIVWEAGRFVVPEGKEPQKARDAPRPAAGPADERAHGRRICLSHRFAPAP